MHKHRPSFIRYMISSDLICRGCLAEKKRFECKDCGSTLKIRKNGRIFLWVIDILYLFLWPAYSIMYKSSFREYRTLLLDFLFIPLGCFLLSIMLNVITYVFVDFEVCDDRDKGTIR